MDSLTQVALGAAVGVAVMHRRTAVWKAALWGAVAGTLPDLDVFIDHGDPVANMVLHRAETHAPFWLTLFSLPFAAAVARLHGEWALWRRWWLALWLALVTHPLLDALTIYGTQLALPFSDRPYGLGSVFIIDPLATLPWLAGVAWALVARGSAGGLRANRIGLALGSLYLAWGVMAQQWVQRSATEALAAQGIQAERLLVTPAAITSVLWRVVAVGNGSYHEGYTSLLDRGPGMHFERFDQGLALAAELGDNTHLQRIRAFSHGFYKLQERDGRVLLSDLRMGAEPHYSFTFEIAERSSPLQALAVPLSTGARAPIGEVWSWYWRRLAGEPLPPPR